MPRYVLIDGRHRLAAMETIWSSTPDLVPASVIHEDGSVTHENVQIGQIDRTALADVDEQVVAHMARNWNTLFASPLIVKEET